LIKRASTALRRKARRHYAQPDVGTRHSERSVSKVEEAFEAVGVDKEGFDCVTPKGTAPLPHSDPFGALSLTLALVTLSAA